MYFHQRAFASLSSRDLDLPPQPGPVSIPVLVFYPAPANCQDILCRVQLMGMFGTILPTDKVFVAKQATPL
jgi:hypothetical protein